jgi:NAD(P)H-dependent flavin oxidoreductase YrpB (nitropropane dioxygenase family)
LGFGPDWKEHDLRTIVGEVLDYIKAENLNIPVVAAGGIFTGSDAVAFLEQGVAAVQVATRFTVTKECGMPDDVKQEYFKASEDGIEVNNISPTGYPMRMLSNTPAIGSNIRPGCESYGYLLDGTGNCSYINSYNRELEANPDNKNFKVMDKTCLCTHMRNFNCWTCGHYTYRLKDTTHKLEDGTYQLLSAEHVFKDYQFSINNEIALPE